MQNIETLSFEQVMAELEQIVTALEGGALALDKSVALYQRGHALAARCQQLLDEAELQVQQLTPGEGALSE